MGWPHYVYIAQNVYENIAMRSGLQEQWLVSQAEPHIGEFRQGFYIEDHLSLGTSGTKYEQRLEAALKVSEEAGLPANPSKLVHATREPTIILGIEFHSDGTICPETGNLRGIICFTRAFVRFPNWKKSTLHRALGK